MNLLLLLLQANCKRQPECEICHKKFRGPGMLKMHMKTHEERSLRCELCLKTFQNEYHLSLHMMKHKKLSTNPFRCEPCNMSFISANELKVSGTLFLSQATNNNNSKFNFRSTRERIIRRLIK